jgi:hypothetical protein
MDEKHRLVVETFRDNPAVRIHRATSQEALSALPDGYLDWVYIDGNHNEPFIGQDIALCLRKVKPNGMIAGDDYNWQAEQSGAPVRRAVEAALAELGPKASLRLMANQYLIALNRG